MRHLRSDYDPIQWGLSDEARSVMHDLLIALGSSTDPDTFYHTKQAARRLIDAVPKIPDDEPVFVIRAADPLASMVVGFWAYQQHQAGADTALCARVFDWASEMDAYRVARYGTERKHADVPDGALR